MTASGSVGVRSIGFGRFTSPKPGALLASMMNGMPSPTILVLAFSFRVSETM